MNSMNIENNSYRRRSDDEPIRTKERDTEHKSSIGKKIGALALIGVATFGAYQVIKTPDAHASNETIQLRPGQTRWDIANQVVDNYNNQNNFKKIDTGDAMAAIDKINHNDNDVDQIGETIVVPQFDKW